LAADHEQKIRDPGAATSAAEVTNISKHGFWLLLDGRELFLPFEDARHGGHDPAARATNARTSSVA
jgi:hypothetical protein